MTLLGQHGQPQDYARGIQLVRQAAASADENAPQGAYVLGMLQARELPQISVPEIFLPFNEKEARQSIERAAFLGFAKAQLKMGSAYELCMLGCEFNPALSLHYNALAARQGEAEADMAISKWFLCGFEGVFQKNEELAYTYAQRAAQQALPTAEFAMGYFNEIGVHVPVNIEKALSWYEKAATNGNKDAEARIESISKQRTLSKKDHENVAISRIKSQYGSKRGGRPDRFKSPAPPLPNIVESTPSPSVYSQDTPLSANAPPPRQSSTTPYPTSSGPPVLPPIDRPATVAPYPLENGPPKTGPSPVGGFYATPGMRPQSAAPAPMQRPASAFQINPNIYPADGGRPSNQTGAGGRPGSGRPLPNQGGPGFYRPSTAAPAGERVDSRPEAASGPRPNLPQLDIGYTAPLEIKKHQRLGQPQTAGSTPSNPSLATLGYQAPLDAKLPLKSPGLPTSPRPFGGQQQGQGRQSSTPGPGSAGRVSPSASAGTPKPPGAYPPRKDSAPASNKPLPKPTQQPVSASKPLPKPAAPASKPTAPSRPPGKGPKTFDEMGIGQAKQDSDCVRINDLYARRRFEYANEFATGCYVSAVMWYITTPTWYSKKHLACCGRQCRVDWPGSGFDEFCI